jgi:hypothetical protein
MSLAEVSDDVRETVENVIARIENGESERSACQAEGIHRVTFRLHVLECQMASQYAQALAALAMEQVEKLEQTIDDMRNGTLDAAQARVEIDARKWFASKFLPKRFGERLQVAGDPNQPLIPSALDSVDFASFTPEQRAILRQAADIALENQREKALEDGRE